MMIRKIVDFQKLNEEILNLLIEKFPDGYDDSDIITFKNARNEVVEAVEVRTENTVYLVKVGKRLVQAMEDFVDDLDDIDIENQDQSDLDFDQIKGQDDNDLD
jgi:DNA-directed RNA polymerase subunit delta